MCAEQKYEKEIKKENKMALRIQGKKKEILENQTLERKTWTQQKVKKNKTRSVNELT